MSTAAITLVQPHPTRSAVVCTGCRHIATDKLERAWCNHPHTAQDVVFGLAALLCRNARGEAGPCGPQGALFAPKAAANERSATPTAELSNVLPNIGAPWPGIEHSAYAGVARALAEGEADGHLVLLVDKPPRAMAWAAAKAWAESLGDGARLPTRFESALLYANLRDRMDRGEWHWTGTPGEDGSYAWNQAFGNGYQGLYHKSYDGRARAVRRFSLSPLVL